MRWALLAHVGGVPLDLKEFFDTNMLVSATQKSHVRGMPKAYLQREGFGVTVEYRL